MRNEIKVGIFILLSLLAILYLTFQVKSLEDFKEKGYVLYAVVNDASGLARKSRVKMRGVKIGIVKDMELIRTGVKLKLLINKNVEIPKGSVVAVAQDNVLGGKYLEIVPSNNTVYYNPGDTIKKYLKTASMADVMNNINSAVNDIKILIKKLNNTLDENTTKNIKLTIANIKESSDELKSVIKIANQKLPKLLDNANALVVTYKQTGDIIKRKIPGILNKTDILMSKLNLMANTLHIKIKKLADEYIKLGQNANNLLSENKSSLKATINSAKSFFDSGSSSFKKIDEFLSSINKSQIDMDIYSNYLTKDDYFKTTANLAYIPNPTKYYIIGVTSKEDYSTKKLADEKTSKIYLNAELGKRYQNILVRGGIIENTGGLGIDYFMYKDRLKLSADIYDFNSENDYRGDNPHLDLKARYLYLKHLEFLAGIDNIINSDARQFFLGIGVKFKDNDLKALLSGGATSLLK